MLHSENKLISNFSSIIYRDLVSVLQDFWYKISTIVLVVLAFLAVVVMRLLRPLVVIRLGRLASRRIGAFLADPDLYLAERDAGKHNGRVFDIFYYYLPISNYQVKKMWERTRRLRIFPFTRFTHTLDRLNRLFPGSRRYRIEISDQDLRGVLVNKQPYLSFLPAEERWGREALQQLGVSDGAGFVCFHARDSAYLDTVFPGYNWSYQDFRDSSIHNYIPAAEELTRRGYFMIRMGAAVKEAIKTKNPMIIDYAVKQRTEFLDIYLGAKCRFFICDTAGIACIPMVFRRPKVWVNFVQLGIIPTSGWMQDLLIPKKLWWRKESRFLRLQEIIGSEIGAEFRTVEQYEQSGIELIENTPQEILAVAVEMDERLKGMWKTTEEDEELQGRFFALLRAKGYDQKVIPRLGTEFLRQNRELLK